MIPTRSADDDDASTMSRPASLWPESTRPAEFYGAGTGGQPGDAGWQRAGAGNGMALEFDLCHPALALRAVLFVQAVLAAAALAGASSGADWAARQAVLAFIGVAGTGLWLVSVCALRPIVSRLHAGLRATVACAAGAGAALAGWVPLGWAGLTDASLLRTFGVAVAGAGFAGLLWVWLAMRARIRAPADASARLAELQSRIRPHFLFNALNTALALVRVDPERAESVLEDLAELFRTALAEAGTSVSLAEEIELARRYLAIEQVRFGARLVVQWQVDARVGSAQVPPLVLQPLVENAVRHGIESAPEGGTVVVRARLLRGQTVVLVSNTVGDGPRSPGHGIALQNIRERLRLLHDVAAQCDVWREGGLFHARIVLPAP